MTVTAMNCIVLYFRTIKRDHLVHIPALIASRLAGVSLWAVITLQTNPSLSLKLYFQQAKMVVHYQVK